MGAAEAADRDVPRRAGYQRPAGTPRGEARRRELLDQVVDDLAVNGLLDFSLRRAARAAGTTHRCCSTTSTEPTTCSGRPSSRCASGALPARWLRLTWRSRRRWRPGCAPVWPALAGEEPPVLDQVIGLMRYDPDRYAGPRRGRFAAVHACTATAVLLPAGPARAT